MDTFNFTKKAIAELPPAPEGKQVEYADSGVVGLRVRVGATGIKAFCITRYREKKFIRATLGRFPDMSVDMARAKALEMLGAVAKDGKNPNEVKREDRNKSVTLADALAEYLKSRAQRIKQTTIDQYQGILTNFSGDWLKTPLAAIDRERVEARHKAITDGGVWFGDKPQRAGVATGSKAQADLWARVLRAVYRYSHDHYRDSDGNRLLFKSRKPAARLFKRWVTSEVLPSIRSTGGYVGIAPVPAIDFSDPATAARAWADEYEAKKQITGYAQRQAKYIDHLESLFSEGLTPVQFCRRLNGINTSKVNAWLMEKNWLYDDTPNAHRATWRVYSYARDLYLTETSKTITPNKHTTFEAFSPVLLKKGAVWLYRHYLKGEMPMKTDWNGEYTHDKELAELVGAQREV